LRKKAIPNFGIAIVISAAEAAQLAQKLPDRVAIGVAGKEEHLADLL
jgi:hypothetical protein